MNNYHKRPLKPLKHVTDRLICKNFFGRRSYPTCGPEILLKRYSGFDAFRNSRSQMFYKIGVLRNFAEFTEKQPEPETSLKKETLAQVFSCEFYEICKNTFLTEHLKTTASGYSRKYCSLLKLP